MLMSSLASIQAAGVFTPATVPIEQTYGLPAETKDDNTSASTTNNDEPSSAAAARQPEEDAPSGEPWASAQETNVPLHMPAKRGRPRGKTAKAKAKTGTK